MKAVLRIAWYFFSMTPLQKWLNTAGAMLFALGAVSSPLPALFGVILLCIAPAMAGGVGLRYAATRHALHLAPYGRIKLVAGAMLAISAVAGLAAIPWIMPLWDVLPWHFAPANGPDPFRAFLVVWCLTSLWWVALFAISFNYAAFALLGIIPVVGFAIGRHLGGLIPGPAGSAALCLLVWCGFCLWLLITPKVSRPQVVPMGGSVDPNAGTILARISGTRAVPARLSKADATYMMLFGGRPQIFYISGLWVAAIFLLVCLIGPMRAPNASPLFMLPFLAFFPASVATNCVRRARLLWLRTDADRRGLYGLAERWGLRSSMITWAISAAVVVGVSLRPGRFSPEDVLLYTAAQVATAAVMFYGALALARGWSVYDVILAILFGAPAIAQALMLPILLKSDHRVVVALVIALVALAMLLRWHGARLWQTLDWRVVKIPQAQGRTG